PGSRRFALLQLLHLIAADSQVSHEDGFRKWPGVREWGGSFSTFHTSYDPLFHMAIHIIFYPGKRRFGFIHVGITVGVMQLGIDAVTTRRQHPLVPYEEDSSIPVPELFIRIDPFGEGRHQTSIVPMQFDSRHTIPCGKL